VVQGAIVTVSLPSMTHCPPRRKYKAGSHPPRQRRAPQARLAGQESEDRQIGDFGEGHGVAPRDIPSVNTRPRWGASLARIGTSCGDDDGLKGYLKFLAIREPKVFAMLICRALPPPSRASVRRRPIRERAWTGQ
jgi:hypothetical protein